MMHSIDIFRSRLARATAVATALFPVWGNADDWPRWRGPNADGISSETGWRSSFGDGEEAPVLWRGKVGTGFSSFAVVDGRVYTLGHDGQKQGKSTVFCLGAATGDAVWKHSFDAPLDDKYYEGGPTSTPTVDGGFVYVVGKRGKLLALDAKSGDVRWEVDAADLTGAPMPTWGFSGSPVIDGDHLFLNMGKSGAAFSKEDGKLVWKSEAAEAGYSTPVLFDRGGRRMAIFSHAKGYSAVDAKLGDVVWDYKWLTRYGVNASDPIVSGDHVFIASGYGKGSTLIRMGDGPPEEVWREKLLRTQMNPAVRIGGFLYGTDGNESKRAPLQCVEFATGAERWSEKGVGTGGVIVVDKKLVVLSEKGELIVAPVSTKKFEPTLRFQVLGGRSWTAPVLSGGLVFCRNSKGDVACVDLRGESGPEALSE